MSKKRPMREEVKRRRRERAARRVSASRLEAVDWHAACDHCLEVHEQQIPEVIARMKAKDTALVVRAPSRLPSLATEILKRRRPHIPCVLSSWPAGYREPTAFAWEHLRTIFEFHGFRLDRRGEPSYVTRPTGQPLSEPKRPPCQD